MLRIVLVALAAISLLSSPAVRAEVAQSLSTVTPSAPTEHGSEIEPAPPPRAIDIANLSAYTDGLVDAAMERDRIAGVTVAIVDSSGPLLLRGYGIAGLTPSRDVDPQDTLFRIASISKTFTYLLGLKRVDEGQIDLDRPVNDYLPADLQLPDDGYAPVLVRHLFSHSAGFEDSALGHIFFNQPDRVPTAGDYLRQHRPARVREPGTQSVYSNYSVALLGALVAHLGETDFATLAERELFQPMGMRDTTFREPFAEGDARAVDARLRGRWSDGFKRGAGTFKAQDFEYVSHGAPSGGASSSATDMGRYMRMLLAGGELDGVQVLSDSAYRRLLSPPLFGNAPQVGGFSYGFFNNPLGETRTLGHGGATFWFHSAMIVVPELDVGIFIATNTDTGRRFAGDFPRRILERYFPQTRPETTAAVPDGFDAARFTGHYNSKRSNHSRSERPFTLSTVKVTAADDHSLVLSSGGEASRWIPEDDLVFRAAEGPGRIVFSQDGDGRILGYANALGHNVFERVSALSILDTLGIGLFAAGATALLVLVGAWLRRRRRDPAGPAARGAASWLYLTATAWLAYTLLLVGYLRSAMTDLAATNYGYPGQLLPVLLWSAPVLFVLTAIAVLHLRPVLRARAWGFWRRLRHLAAVAVFAFACGLLWSWNLVGWKL